MSDDLRSQIISIIEQCVTVTDEWGGSKLAEWRYGSNVCIEGMEGAADEIIKAVLENKQ